MCGAELDSTPMMAEREIDLEIHSPITPIHGPELEAQGISLWMKRDDLIHPFISGNKWRKLKYALRDARRLGRKRLVTFGGAWSNHLLATACAGAMFGFRTLGFVRGDESASNPVLSLCRLFGMELVYVDRTRYRDKDSVYESHCGRTPNQTLDYRIDEGGFGPHALEGCAEIIGELMGPGDSLPPFDHIFCACGTGATLAGLAKGLATSATHTPQQPILHGIPVLRSADFLIPQIRTLYPHAHFEWHTEYHFGGYAKSSPELESFIRQFCADTGILIEPVYTGKLCFGVFDMIRKGAFPRGSRILILHSGGLTGMLGMHQRF